MWLKVELALLFIGAWLVFFFLVPVESETPLSKQTTEFSSRARSSDVIMDDQSEKGGLRIAIEGRLRWLGFVK